jgi:cobalamin biosynthesis protein CobT
MNAAMSNNMLVKSMPIVAAALGKKHGVKVVMNSQATTAATDGSTIILPALPDTHEAVTLVRGFIDHESAHVRYTDFEQIKGLRGLSKGLLNVLEDVRIEKLLGDLLPGCKINLDDLETYFVANDFYGNLDENSSPSSIIMNHIHHDLRVRVLKNNATRKLAQKTKALYQNAFPPEVVQAVDEIIDEAAQGMVSTAHARSLADRIMEVLKDELEKQKEKEKEESSQDQQQDSNDPSQQGESSVQQDQSSGGGNDDSGDDEEQSDQQSGGKGSSKKDDSSDDNQNSDSDSGDSDEGSDGGDQDDQNQKGGSGNGDQDDGDPCDSGSQPQDGESDDGSDAGAETPQAGSGHANPATQDQKQNLQDLVENQDHADISNTDAGDRIKQVMESISFAESTEAGNLGSFPVVLDEATSHRSHISQSTVARETNALRTRLNGLIQAKKLVRSAPRRVGMRIDTRSLHKLSVNDNRIFRGRTERKSVNTGVMVMLDQSGSMGNIKDSATKAAMAVAYALGNTPGVKLSVAGFSSQYAYVDGRQIYQPYVKPMKGFNERLNEKDFVADAAGGTPMAEALWWSASELLGLNGIERRILLVVTDGDPDCSHSTIDIRKKMESAGIEVKAIGINHIISKHLIPDNCTINNIAELPNKLFGMLQDSLIG